MEEVTSVDSADLGHHLSQLREQAGIKQGELARQVGISPAVLSRIEAGERLVSWEELDSILEAIGTDGVTGLKDALKREWVELPRPSLDHPDQNLLWEAETTLRDLKALQEQPDIRSAFAKRLAEYILEIEQAAQRVLKRDYNIAFIGGIGIGKSTGICKAIGLEVPGQAPGTQELVLEVGAGGITLCDVHIRRGPGYGLMIEPRSTENIRADVTDFADYIFGGESTAPDDIQDEGSGISKEVERAVRNMAGLKVRREKGTDGKITRIDEAKQLAQQYTSAQDFVTEVLARMNLHGRNQVNVWHDVTYSKPPLAWLKDTFEAINNGRHTGFTLPERIEIFLPDAVLGHDDLNLRVIDTKGLDRTSVRADLEAHLYEPHTLSILCSGFNDAPAAATQILLERARDAGNRSLQARAALLVLPRSDEALAVKDESGIRVESVTEGYELKGEQVAMALQPLVHDFSVTFYNAREDDAKDLRAFLKERVDAMRAAFRSDAQNVLANARNLLGNHEQEQSQEVIRLATGHLQTWANLNLEPAPSAARVQDSLIGQMERAYASTVRATVRRDGQWSNLSYSHHLGHGAKRMATASLMKKVEGFSAICENLAENPDLREASDLIRQTQRVLEASFEEMLRKVQIMGETAFSGALETDQAFWQQCRSEWGRGSGYKNRVIDHTRNWFDAEPRLEIENTLKTQIKKEWSLVVGRMTSLLES